MVRVVKLYKRILNNQKNVKFADFVTLVESFGFELDRSKGSHQIYKHPEISQAFLTLQTSGNNQAKPYQIKQFLRLVEEYNLKMAGDEEETTEESDDTQEEDNE